MRHSIGMRILFTVGVLVGSLALLGCPKRPEVAQAGPGAVGPSAAVRPAPAAPTPKAAETPVTRPSVPAETPVPPQAAPRAAGLKDVFFDFDKSNVREDQRAAITDDAAWLKANAKARVTIEGHCDERGTEEYNLALGERRARTVRDTLVAAGIGSDRIATVSYGKDRPFVLGHDESAWKLNRRGHLVAME